MKIISKYITTVFLNQWYRHDYLRYLSTHGSVRWYTQDIWISAAQNEPRNTIQVTVVGGSAQCAEFQSMLFQLEIALPPTLCLLLVVCCIASGFPTEK